MGSCEFVAHNTTARLELSTSSSSSSSSASSSSSSSWARENYFPTIVRRAKYCWVVIPPREQCLMDYPAQERNFEEIRKGNCNTNLFRLRDPPELSVGPRRRLRRRRLRRRRLRRRSITSMSSRRTKTALAAAAEYLFSKCCSPCWVLLEGCFSQRTMPHGLPYTREEF